MKVSFSRLVEYVPEWNGNKDLPEAEQVKVKLVPLEMGDLVGLMEVIQDFTGDADEEGKTTVAMDKAVSVLKNISHLSGSIEVINLEDDSGPVTSEDIVKFPRFMELTMEVFNELASISMPNEEDEKNSKAQPD